MNPEVVIKRWAQGLGWWETQGSGWCIAPSGTGLIGFFSPRRAWLADPFTAVIVSLLIESGRHFHAAAMLESQMLERSMVCEDLIVISDELQAAGDSLGNYIAAWISESSEARTAALGDASFDLATMARRRFMAIHKIGPEDMNYDVTTGLW